MKTRTKIIFCIISIIILALAIGVQQAKIFCLYAEDTNKFNYEISLYDVTNDINYLKLNYGSQSSFYSFGSGDYYVENGVIYSTVQYNFCELSYYHNNFDKTFCGVKVFSSEFESLYLTNCVLEISYYYDSNDVFQCTPCINSSFNLNNYFTNDVYASVSVGDIFSSHKMFDVNDFFVAFSDNYEGNYYQFDITTCSDCDYYVNICAMDLDATGANKSTIFTYKDFYNEGSYQYVDLSAREIGASYVSKTVPNTIKDNYDVYSSKVGKLLYDYMNDKVDNFPTQTSNTSLEFFLADYKNWRLSDKVFFSFQENIFDNFADNFADNSLIHVYYYTQTDGYYRDFTGVLNGNNTIQIPFAWLKTNLGETYKFWVQISNTDPNYLNPIYLRKSFEFIGQGLDGNGYEDITIINDDGTVPVYDENGNETGTTIIINPSDDADYRNYEDYFYDYATDNINVGDLQGKVRGVFEFLKSLLFIFPFEIQILICLGFTVAITIGILRLVTG